MARYSPELKDQIVRRMMPPNNQSVADLSRHTGISAPTLYAWKKQIRSQGYIVPDTATSPDKWDVKAKLRAVAQTMPMNEAECSAWCRENGIYPEQIAAWRQAFETMQSSASAAERAVSTVMRKRVKQLEKELLRKDRALAEAAALLTLSKKGPGSLGHRRGRLIPASLKQRAVTLIAEAVAAGAREIKACQVLGISCRTLRRWRGASTLVDARKGAAKHCPHALSCVDKERIMAVANQPDYQSLPPSQIVPRLADQGIYIASESSMYRVLRARGQVNRRGRAAAPRTVAKPMAVRADAPRQVWSWDITYLPSTVKGQFFKLYMILDVYSRKIVGWEVHHEELAIHASVLIGKACMREQVARDTLVLHADNGGPMKAATMLATLQSLHVTPSFSRPRVSDDNPYSEALFRTLKYAPAYPSRPFTDITCARSWVAGFVDWYNNEHRHSGIRFVTPHERHERRDQAILAARADVYREAAMRHPSRWRGRATRNWTPVGAVWLNPDNDDRKAPDEMKFAA
ncbi:IS3 family transposase [Xanthomonas cucurbitae]|uniref:IS3 family transposase n=1 Tax=Xanthomonas cucurbitae TaxID=56453 RepID=UPI003CE57B71